MKQKLLFSISTLMLVFTLKAQVTDLVTGVSGAYDLLVNGNDLYVAEFTGNKISKIDITSSSPTSVDVITGLNGPDGMFLDGNNLYIAEYGANQVVKIDISSPTPAATLDTVATGVNGPVGLLLNGNDLYIAEFNVGRISKIDITLPFPITEKDTVVEGLNVDGSLLTGVNSLEFHDNNLYFSENFTGRSVVSRVDLTLSTPITPELVIDHNNASGPIGLLLIGTDLYVVESTNDEISKVDLTTSNFPTTLSRVSGTSTFGSGPIEITFDGTNMYIAEYNTSKITKFTLVPSTPTLTLTSDTVCKGTYARISTSASDTLNGGIDWFLYENSITGTPLDSSRSGRFDLTGNVTTNYIVRGEGVGFEGQPDTITLVVNTSPEFSVTQSLDTLIASTSSNVTYQWFDCNDNSAIAGATDSVYIASGSGDFRVVLTDAVTGCDSTSECFNVTISGVSELEKAINFSMYPNPTNGIFTVELINQREAILEIRNGLGQMVLTERISSNKEELDLSSEERGIYLIKLTTSEGSIYRKLLLQ